MIVEMTKIRILGPRSQLEAALRALQEVGVVHLTKPVSDHLLNPAAHSAQQERRVGQVRRILEDVEQVQHQLEVRGRASAEIDAAPGRLARWARLGRRLRRRVEQLAQREAELEEERALIAKYRYFFSAFEHLLEAEAALRQAHPFYLLMRPGQDERLAAVKVHLKQLLGDAFSVLSETLSSGETAVVLLVPVASAKEINNLLQRADVHSMPVPAGYGGGSMAAAAAAMSERDIEIPRQLEELRAERRRLTAEHGAELLTAQACLHDLLLELAAYTNAALTPRAFVLEGWVPKSAVAPVEGHLAHSLAATVTVERLASEAWAGEEAPVVLSNPRLFRPFEAITGLLPLPRYGTIDPTPFVAVFFPMFFGVILGDVGYGAILALLALVLRRGSESSSTRRTVSEIAGACALFTLIFGALYGEIFGDLGRGWGVRPLAFNREEAVLPFLGLAVALGLVHVLLGLGLAVFTSFRGARRHSLGRGLAAAMILLILVALLAAFGVLPAALFTPVIVILLVVFPVLIAVEGIVAPIELLSTLGNILSYARIMALGTASVMMAVVANRMVGAAGSVAVGVVFALLFHLVNFVIGVFGPTVHALRLHYVEFFGKFYSPGGLEYRPLGHWHPDPQVAESSPQ